MFSVMTTRCHWGVGGMSKEGEFVGEGLCLGAIPWDLGYSSPSMDT